MNSSTLKTSEAIKTEYKETKAILKPLTTSTSKVNLANPAPYRPELVTIAEAHRQSNLENKTLMEEKVPLCISDHLPLLTKVPFDVSQTKKELTCITYNLGAPGKNASGHNIEENESQWIKRGNLSLEKLELIIDRHKPDFLFLQETYLVTNFATAKYQPVIELEKKLNEMLAKKGFALKKSERGISTVYRKEFKVHEEKERKGVKKNKTDRDYEYNTLEMEFEIAGRRLSTYNVHWDHRELPQEAEDQVFKRMNDLNQLTSNETKEEKIPTVPPVKIVIGDFNNRIITPGKNGEKRKNLINGLVNPQFRTNIMKDRDKKFDLKSEAGKNLQGCDFTDGGFCKINDELRELRCEVINPTTGEICEEVGVDFTKVTSLQQIDMLRPRPCMSMQAGDRNFISRFQGAEKWKQHGVFIGRCANIRNDVSWSVQFRLTDANRFLMHGLKLILGKNSMSLVLDEKKDIGDEVTQVQEFVTFPFPDERANEIGLLLSICNPPSLQQVGMFKPQPNTLAQQQNLEELQNMYATIYCALQKANASYRKLGDACGSQLSQTDYLSINLINRKFFEIINSYSLKNEDKLQELVKSFSDHIQFVRRGPDLFFMLQDKLTKPYENLLETTKEIIKQATSLPSADCRIQ